MGPALPTIPAASTYPEPPLQVTTTMNGDQFVCLNLNNPNDQNGNPPAYPLSSEQVGEDDGGGAGARPLPAGDSTGGNPPQAVCPSPCSPVTPSDSLPPPYCDLN